QLQQEHGEAAGRVAEALRKAKELAPDEPDLLDKLQDAVGGAFVDLSNSIADGVDQAWNFVQDHAELLSKLSDVAGDLGNMLGIASDLVPDPAGMVLGAVSAGLGVAALEGHLTAKAAGADVALETLTFDGLGAITSVAGVIPGVPKSGALAITAGGYALLAEQLGGEAAAGAMGKQFEGPINDFKSYWVPKDTNQVAVAAASWAGMAAWNAAQAGVAADTAPERARERAEDEVWN
ncbi:MAG TPA: hypothetical protein VGL05_20070, partial [Kribbella sp.]